MSYTLLSLGICLQKVARLEEAEQLFRCSLTIREAKLDPHNLLISDALHHLCRRLCAGGRSFGRETGGLLRHCLAIQEASRSKIRRNNVPINDTLSELDICDRIGGKLQ